MGVFGMSDEEKKIIHDKHKEAIKSHNAVKDELKKGVQVPNKKDNPSKWRDFFILRSSNRLSTTYQVGFHQRL